MARGYVGIGIEGSKTPANLGTLFRSAHEFGATFVFTVGQRWPGDRCDTMRSTRHMPLLTFPDVGALADALDEDCSLVGVEQAGHAMSLPIVKHPERACYLLGAEDSGLSEDTLRRCDRIVEIPTDRCLNVAVAGSIVLYDRAAKAAVPA
jgi:tRNA G18 (ribose-2'-O)-methylase SpoU